MATDSGYTYSLTYKGGGDLDLVTAQVQRLARLDTADDYKFAGTLLAQVLERLRAIEAWYAEERQPFADVTKILRAREKAALEPWQALQDVLQTAMREYETQSKAARRSALNEAMAAASEAGTPVSLPDLVTQQAVPDIEGLQSRELWAAEVVTMPLLVVSAGMSSLLDIWDEMIANIQGEPLTPEFQSALKAFIETWVTTIGRVPMEALLPNQAWLNAQAREARSALKLPGVVAVKRQIYARGRKREDGDGAAR